MISRGGLSSLLIRRANGAVKSQNFSFMANRTGAIAVSGKGNGSLLSSQQPCQSTSPWFRFSGNNVLGCGASWQKHQQQLIARRYFQNESEYHTAANETLEDIQDAVEQALEEKGLPEFEVTLASGVLTMVMPPHGTWVINKQTPNRQIWWSSPISGPRRYEYEDGEWVFTRDESHSMTLFQALQEEVHEIYEVDLDL